jgi:hypothetical protein
MNGGAKVSAGVTSFLDVLWDDDVSLCFFLGLQLITIAFTLLPLAFMSFGLLLN